MKLYLCFTLLSAVKRQPPHGTGKKIVVALTACWCHLHSNCNHLWEDVIFSTIMPPLTNIKTCLSQRPLMIGVNNTWLCSLISFCLIRPFSTKIYSIHDSNKLSQTHSALGCSIDGWMWIQHAVNGNIVWSKWRTQTGFKCKCMVSTGKSHSSCMSFGVSVY